MNTYFEVQAVDKETAARAGLIKTAHGSAKTPLYMPVATKGAVKTLSPFEVKELGYEVILSNTYHLIEKPGVEEIASFGGLHEYMSWNSSILTDSGGYQVFSLHRTVKIEDDGVVFRSLIDGKKVKLTPETVIDYQSLLRSDISMVLDVCTPFGISKDEARKALEITESWAKRSHEHWQKTKKEGRLLFGIVQGNFFSDLRERAVKNMVEIDFEGYAVGGLSVGEPKEVMFEISGIVVEHLPKHKPRYFMGLGDPPSILKAIAQGYDMFDSALSTRIARGGSFYTFKGPKNIRNAEFKAKKKPLDESCDCIVCRNFSLGYIRHLYLSEETLALRLLTYHNLYFMKKLLEKARSAIEEGRYKEFLKNFLDNYSEN